MVELGKMQRKNLKLMLKSNSDDIEGNSRSLDTDGGVKVLSEKTGSGDNFYNDRRGPESIRINVRNLSDKL